MTQRTALYAALAITAFVIIATASVALAWPTLRQTEILSDPSTASETLAVPESLPATADIDPQTLLATVQARDKAYRSQIEQANQQISDAYQRLSELEAQNSELLQREQMYQQRLQESALIIESMVNNQPRISAVYGDRDDEDDD